MLVKFVIKNFETKEYYCNSETGRALVFGSPSTVKYAIRTLVRKDQYARNPFRLFVPEEYDSNKTYIDLFSD